MLIVLNLIPKIDSKHNRHQWVILEGLAGIHKLPCPGIGPHSSAQEQDIF